MKNYIHKFNPGDLIARKRDKRNLSLVLSASIHEGNYNGIFYQDGRYLVLRVESKKVYTLSIPFIDGLYDKL